MPVCEASRLDRRLDNTEGFSLLELLIVVAVVSVLAVGGSIAAVSREQTSADPRVFLEMLNRAQALAVNGRQVQGLRVTREGITRFERISGDWKPVGRERAWRSEVIMHGEYFRKTIAGPNIVLFPNGETSAFDIAFRTGGGGEIRCQRGAGLGAVCE